MPDLLVLFKERMHIFHDIEDNNITRILDASEQAIKRDCGVFESDNHLAIELILERSRYVYNDSIEFFGDNFREQLMSLSLELFTPSGDSV